MKIYNYDSEGYFRSESDARPNPKEGGFLIPKNATSIKPDEVELKEYEKLQFNGEWSVVKIQSLVDKALLEVNEEGVLLKELDENGDVVDRDALLIQSETEAKIAEKEATAYILQRISSYPSLGDQLDMLYHDKKNGTTKWEDLITSIKTQYPKP